MTDTEVKKLARQFMNEQKEILEEHGDTVVRSKYKEAVLSAERTFRAIVSGTAATAKTPSAQSKS
jgi:hypothetical protein